MREVKNRDFFEWVRTASSIASIVVLLAGLIGAWYVMQHRIEASERAISDIRLEDKDDRKQSNDRFEELHELRADVKSIKVMMAEQKDILMKIINCELQDRRTLEREHAVDHTRVLEMESKKSQTQTTSHDQTELDPMQ